MPIKRGIADAVRRLYTERAALRYDGQSRQLRMADVIELTHPSPRDSSAYEYAYAGSFEAAVRFGSTVLMNPSLRAVTSPQAGDPEADRTPAHAARHHLNRMIAAPFTRFG